MSSDVTLRFPGVTDLDIESQLVQALEKEFGQIHLHKERTYPHKLAYISSDVYPTIMDHSVIFVPTHWDYDHTQETEEDLHKAADRLEIRIETYQSGTSWATDWADRETVFSRGKVR